jgi:hypothetical protein
MSTKIAWNGTPVDGLALADAIARNCTCEFGKAAARLRVCAAHEMLTDQRTLDRLLFAHHMASRLLIEEFLISRTTRVPS